MCNLKEHTMAPRQTTRKRNLLSHPSEKKTNPPKTSETKGSLSGTTVRTGNCGQLLKDRLESISLRSLLHENDGTVPPADDANYNMPGTVRTPVRESKEIHGSERKSIV
jgi:hypothetical protein